jgi:preprotein translocase subunit SecA
VERFLGAAGIPDEVPIESKMVSNAIRSAQSQVESQNFEIRKNVLKYDDVMNRQREIIYGERRRVLEGEDLQEQIQHFANDTIAAYISGATSDGFPEDWDLDQLWTALKNLYPVGATVGQVEEAAGGRNGITPDFLITEMQADMQLRYSEREEMLGAEVMRELERRVVLSVLDRKWREHLYEMDYLQEGIGLRAMAQRDPLVEYQREGFELFTAMMDSIKEESVGYLFNVEVQIEQDTESATPEIAAQGLQAAPVVALQYSAPTETGEATTRTANNSGDNATTRNAPCPCGSGKKYKRCHGDPRNR